nr:hypothetical protein [uncultured Cohaesibacter sp.]
MDMFTSFVVCVGIVTILLPICGVFFLVYGKKPKEDMDQLDTALFEAQPEAIDKAPQIIHKANQTNPHRQELIELEQLVAQAYQKAEALNEPMLSYTLYMAHQEAINLTEQIRITLKT